MRTTTGRFLLRAAGVTLIVGALAIVYLYRATDWGTAAVPLILWAVFWALVLGFVGFRSIQETFRVPANQMLRTIAIGVLVRLVVLALSQGAVFAVMGARWGERALLATTLFYLVVLGVEVFSLFREMKLATIQPQGAGEETEPER